MDSSAISPNLPAMIPPPGVIPNFIDPPSQGTALIILVSIFLPLMVIVVLIRFYVKAFILREFGWDDYTCGIASAGSIIHASVTLSSIRLGLGRHLWDIRAITLIPEHNLRQLTSIALIYPFSMFFTKLSILFLYYRLFGKNRNLRYALYIGFAFLTIFYAAYMAVQVVSTIRCAKPTGGDSAVCGNEYTITVTQSVINICTDFYVLVLPVPCVLKLQITTRQKVGILAIFATGAVACFVSVARLIVIVKTLRSPDTLWYAAITSEFSIVETNIAIIAPCVFTLPTFLSNAQSLGSSVYRTFRSRVFVPSGPSQNSATYRGSLSRTKQSSRSNSVRTNFLPPAKVHDSSWLELKETSNFTVTTGSRKLSSDLGEERNGRILRTDTFEVESTLV